jgi:hypothetical protein
VEHPIYRIESFEQKGIYTLSIRFDDGSVRTIDFEPILEGQLLRPLRDPAVFSKVALDPEVHTLVWPSGADFDPAVLHDWPTHAAAFEAAARRWSERSATA